MSARWSTTIRFAKACSGAMYRSVPQYIAGHCHPGVRLDFGQTEVRDPHLARAVDDQVAWLDIAMNDPVFMGMMQTRPLHQTPNRAA